MNECRLVEYSPCKVFGIIISAVIGLVAGILLFNGIVAVTPEVIWFIVIAAAVALGALIVGAFAICCCMCERISDCFCRNLSYLIAGSVGAVVAGLLYIILGFPVGFLGATVFGVLVFFFGLAVTGIICFLLCVCGRDCTNNNSNNTNNNCCCCCTCSCCCDNTVSDNSNTNNCKIC